MKYEAKNDGSNNAVSTASGLPWTTINQRNARLRAQGACAGCHLISEPEWMTMAEDVLFNPANWSSGIVGTGCLFRGNVGNADACGYNGSDPEFGSGRDTKARLQLSTGEYIWDLSGNVWEWTDAWVRQNEEPSISSISEAVPNWREYTAIDQFKGLQYLKPPVDNWSATQGLGRIYTYSNDTAATVRGFRRGGHWSDTTHAGVFALGLYRAPTHAVISLGFRAAR